MKLNSLRDLLKLTAPGMDLRRGLDQILRKESGTMILLVNGIDTGGVISSGLRLYVKMTRQLLVELAKMDGAIVLDTSREKILYANAHLVPDPVIPTEETGTRHKNAERAAK